MKIFPLNSNQNQNGFSLIGLVISMAMVMGFFSIAIKAVNQEKDINNLFDKKLSFLGFEQQIRTGIFQGLNYAVRKNPGCNANFSQWAKLFNNSTKSKPYYFDFKKSALTALPKIIEGRCTKQTSQKSVNKSLYFCAKIRPRNSTIKFLEENHVYLEAKSYYWSPIDQRTITCNGLIHQETVARGVKYYYSIYWTPKKKQKNQAAKLNFYRSWYLAQF